MNMSYPFARLKSGSSLVITLILIAVVGSIIITTSKAIIDSTRLGSAAENATFAEQIAQSGIEEGMLRYKKNVNGLNASGEYGDFTAASGYSLMPMRRGFQSGTLCQTLTLPTVVRFNPPLYDPSCPYYDLTVRSQVSLSASSPSFTLSNRELPLNIAITLPISTFSQFTLILTGNTSQLKYTTSADATGDTLDVTKGKSQVTFSNPITSLSLTVQGSDLGSNLVKIQLFGIGSLVMNKGVTTIDTTGYAGGISRKKIMYIHEQDGTVSGSPRTYNLLDFTRSFSSNGILQ